VDHAVNAMVARDFDRVRATAKAADAAVTRGGELPPLHGHPIGIKDLQEAEGLRTTVDASPWNAVDTEEQWRPTASRHSVHQ
jgi:Asp-tRNA(Asn)/Glu-tRNA(Gln) amidotransferase A subunit family amidase